MIRIPKVPVLFLAPCLLACLVPACQAPEGFDGNTIEQDVIYGEDERYDHYELTDPVALVIASADVALLDTSQLAAVGGGYDIDLWYYGSFGDYFDLCPSEPFESQPAPAFCSGFKVGDDLIATAGHCLDEASCPDTAFVFGFIMQGAATPVGHVGDDDVYFCAEIVDQMDTGTDDWAVVRVDRDIVGHPSLPVRRTSAVESDPDVFGIFVVGHPGGIPLKFVGGAGPAGDTGLRGASVRDTAVNYFETDVDVYAGNSGSAVFSLNQQGELLYAEGILVRGNVDFVPSGSCYVSNVCSETTGCGGSWEEVTRATNFDHLIAPPCGDGPCEAGEDCLSCPADCGSSSPGPVYVDDDFSAGLANWTTSGWTIASMHSSANYPATGSGSPVASSDNCRYCDLDLATAHDLTPYCAVRLSFWRFVDAALESDEYLALWYWNGTGWDNISLWDGGSGNTNQWEYEEYTLDSTYLIPDFSFGFQANTNRNDEFVQIDDVRLLTYQSGVCTVDADCDDFQFCNGAEFCDGSHECQPGTPPALDDGVDCTVDACDEASDVVTHTPDDTVCDDGLFCTGAESCDPVQDCQPGTPPVLEDGVSCTIDACDEANDVVTHTPDDTMCDDGFFCSGAESCDPVQDCQPGTPPVLDDGVSCTIDACDEVMDTVTHTPDDSLCEDGIFCTGAESCDAVNDCVSPGDPCPAGEFCNEATDSCDECAIDADCDDAVGCTDDHCVVGICVFTSNDANCPDDGLFCNGAGSCDPVQDCQAGTPPDLDDGVSCTVDACDETNDVVTHTPDYAACDDDVFCNGVESCDPVQDCQPGMPVVVDDGVACTVDACDEAGDTVTHTPDDSACDDGAFCNGAESCDPVQDCQPGMPVVVDDGVACTVDACDEAGDTVTHTPDDSACNDGAFCSGVESCHPVQDCQPGTPPALDDGVGCTVDACDEAGDTVTHTPDDSACNDGAFCNGMESCDPLQDCQAGVVPDLDDGVACTVDICDENIRGIGHVPDDSLCDDGLFCNGVESCDPVQDCQAGSPPELDDGVACTVDACDENTDSVTHTADDAACDDANPCTTDVCDPTGCTQLPAADGGPCDDSDACTRTDTCQSGVCTGGDPVVCTAQDACHQAGECDPGTGQCSNPDMPDGTACPDGTCQDGVCEPDGSDNGCGGCALHGDQGLPRGGTILFLLLAAILVTRRRRDN